MLLLQTVCVTSPLMKTLKGCCLKIMWFCFCYCRVIVKLCVCVCVVAVNMSALLGGSHRGVFSAPGENLRNIKD